MSLRPLPLEPLTRAAFAPFGEVIHASGKKVDVNDGTARRFDDQARIDVDAADGRPCVSIFVARRRSMPLTIAMLEHHPLGSQAFVPLQDDPYVVVVAPPTRPDRVRAFLARGQGVNYARGVWHHPLIALTDGARFLVIDRAGPGDNCMEAELDAPRIIEALP